MLPTYMVAYKIDFTYLIYFTSHKYTLSQGGNIILFSYY